MAKATDQATTKATKEPVSRSRKGKPNRDYAPADSSPSRCPHCHSTRRGKYFRKIEHLCGGTDPQGKPFTHLVIRYCKCTDCEQHRCDRSYEYRPNE
jgi:hypothetical protein